MWIYQLIRAAREAFPYVMMTLLVFEAILAFGLMFVFPPGSLGLVFLGLLTLLWSGLIRSVLMSCERLVGRLAGVPLESIKASQNPTSTS